MSYPKAVLTIAGDMAKTGSGLTVLMDAWYQKYPDLLVIPIHSPEFCLLQIQFMSASGDVKPFPELLEYLVDAMDDAGRQQLYETLHRKHRCRVR